MIGSHRGRSSRDELRRETSSTMSRASRASSQNKEEGWSGWKDEASSSQEPEIRDARSRRGQEAKATGQKRTGDGHATAAAESTNLIAEVVENDAQSTCALAASTSDESSMERYTLTLDRGVKYVILRSAVNFWC